MPDSENQVNTQGQNMAQQSPEMSLDDHAATLGYITTIAKQFLPQDESVGEESGNDASSEGESTETSELQEAAQDPQPDPQQDIQSVEDNIITEIRGLRSEMGNEDLKAEFQVIKNEIESILNEDDTTKETTA